MFLIYGGEGGGKSAQPMGLLGELMRLKENPALGTVRGIS